MHKLKTWHNISYSDINECKIGKGFCFYSIARLLEKASCLQYMRIYPRLSLFYVYDQIRGIYIEMYPQEMKSFISKLTREIDERISRIKTVTGIFNELLYGPTSFSGDPIYQSADMIPFSNVNLRVTQDNKREEKVFSPDFFLTHRLDYPYNPQATCPEFNQFIEFICHGEKDRIRFIKCWFYAVLFSLKEAQVFLYLWGPGAAGKSTLAHVLTALVGKAVTITTSLKCLHTDPFEIANLKGKKLILISDTEYYRSDVSILKMITGGDSLKGRLKFVQGSTEITPEGLVLIVGNYPMGSKDVSGAMARRLRLFPVDRVVKTRDYNLISYKDGAYAGKLVKELPGILNWVLEEKKEDVLEVLTNLELTPSLASIYRSSEEDCNPILHWIREELEKGDGSYLGYKVGDGIKVDIELAKRRPLFPMYERWAIRRGVSTKAVSHVIFRTQLISCLKAEGYDSESKRHASGIYITGVKIKDEVFSLNNMYGAVEHSQETKEHSGHSIYEGNTSSIYQSNTVDSAPIVLKKDEVHPYLGNKLYGDYKVALCSSPVKDELNRYSESIDIDYTKLTEEFCKECKELSTDYKERVEKKIKEGIDKVKKYGFITYDYKDMGTSPRIIPNHYGKSMNCVKKVVRERVYSLLGKKAFETYNMRIVDVDLSSCYISILLGLFPDHLPSLREALKVGLWKFIERYEFEENNKGEFYNKSAVKVCVYSSVFQGGNSAMQNGILENFRQYLGITNKEFKEYKTYEDLYKLAQNITKIMQNSKIISELRVLSREVENRYLNDTLNSPTGHSYLVDKASFRSAYPNFLQGYEFSILAKATLLTMDAFPNVQLIGHYHDGNTFLVPDDKLQAFTDLLKTNVYEVGKKLGLRYEQKLEIRSVYPPLPGQL